jgi:DNA-directed RNA polymerase III subunit RPC1
VLEITDRELAQPRFVNECTTVYLDSVRDYIVQNIAQTMAEERKLRGMFDAYERSIEWDENTDLSMGASGACFRDFPDFLHSKHIGDDRRP